MQITSCFARSNKRHKRAFITKLNVTSCSQYSRLIRKRSRYYKMRQELNPQNQPALNCLHLYFTKLCVVGTLKLS